VRIIGGEWRGRRLEFPGGTDVRPTPDRVRETLFNWLRDHVVGARCLDLYAGTGALGFEALSRGAREAVMIERDRRLIDALERQKEALGANATIVRSDAASTSRSSLFSPICSGGSPIADASISSDPGATACRARLCSNGSRRATPAGPASGSRHGVARMTLASARSYNESRCVGRAVAW
jgi:hypothetical protein